MVNLLRYIWTNLHLPKKIYTGTARGARDKYQVWLRSKHRITTQRQIAHLLLFHQAHFGVTQLRSEDSHK